VELAFLWSWDELGSDFLLYSWIELAIMHWHTLEELDGAGFPVEL